MFADTHTPSVQVGHGRHYQASALAVTELADELVGHGEMGEMGEMRKKEGKWGEMGGKGGNTET